MSLEKFYTVPQAALELGVSTWTIKRRITKNELMAERTPGGHWRIPYMSILCEQNLLSGNTYQGNNEDDFYGRSPLRYPGGKTRAVKYILDYIPHSVSICSPFFGGGSVELALIDRGQKVVGYDAFRPLVNFWRRALVDPKRIATMAAMELPELTKERFYSLQKRLVKEPDLDVQAAWFFVVNRSSFSGITLSGGMSPGHDRFNKSAIDRLKRFQAPQLRVDAMDFSQSIIENPSAFLYLDPPYAIEPPTLYGNKGNMHNDFDHVLLADMLRQREGWVLSYNDCPYIRQLYAGYNIIEAQWTYGMNNNARRSSEVLILGGQ